MAKLRFAMITYRRASNISNVNVELASSLKLWPGSLYIDPLVKIT